MIFLFMKRRCVNHYCPDAGGHSKATAKNMWPSVVPTWIVVVSFY